MLVLSRKAGECVQIGDEVTLEVRKISGNRVTIAFRAPKDVRILRGELQQAIKAFDPAEDDADETPAPAEEPQRSHTTWAYSGLTVDSAAAI